MLREWSKKPPGTLVNHPDILTRDARILRLYGTLYSSGDLEKEAITADRERFMAETVFESLMVLGNESSDTVKILINNPGGSVVAGFSIIQAIEHLQAKGIDVEMLVTGVSASMASIILAAGTLGKRYALPRSTVHFHSAFFEVPDSMEEKKKERLTENGKRLSLEMRRLLASRTKIPEYRWKTMGHNEPVADEEARLKRVKEFLDDSETYLSAEQALEAGVIDAVLAPGDKRLDEIFRIGGGEK